MSNELMIIEPTRAIQVANERKAVVAALRRDLLIEGVDYGVVPGTTKPTLFKPGAERLCAGLGFNPVFVVTSKVEDWSDENALFHYEVTCYLNHIESGLQVATGVGSCNSKESKYRWRWVNLDDVPHWLNPDTLKTRSGEIFEFEFAYKKRETTGKYGKPESYWQAFDAAIADGSVRRVSRSTKNGESMGYAIGDTVYRIPNDEIFSLTNTILKMATKRALIAAVLIGANASEFFTQDVEDLPGFGGDIVEGTVTEVVEQKPAQNKSAPTGALWFTDAQFVAGFTKEYGMAPGQMARKLNRTLDEFTTPTSLVEAYDLGAK